MVRGKRLHIGEGYAPSFSTQPLNHQVKLYICMISRGAAAPVNKADTCTCAWTTSRQAGSSKASTVNCRSTAVKPNSKDAAKVVYKHSPDAV